MWRSSSSEAVISIHALRKESDSDLRRIPPRGVISIHALRKESDVQWALTYSTRWIFQSTLSVRRATNMSGKNMEDY